MKLGQVGTHIIAEFKTSKHLTDCSAYNNFIRNLLIKSNVNIVGNLEHIFDTGGYTSSFLLAESHVNIHTWPEFELANIDLFLCNYTEDNSEKAKMLMEEIEKFFDPYDTKVRIIKR